jgi:CheY-like chemotaxis protein
MSQTLVLSVSFDPMILETRNLLLRSVGYIVVPAVSIRETIHLFRDGDFDLVILCHTLSLTDRERLTSFIRASGSRIPIVCVSETAAGERIASADATLDKDPAAFLGTLEDLLSKRSKMHPAQAPVAHTDSKASSVQQAATSNSGIDRLGKVTPDRQGRLSSLERTRSRVSSH